MKERKVKKERKIERKIERKKYKINIDGMEDRTANEVQLRIKAGWSVFGRYKEIFQDKEIPIWA